MYFHFSQIFGVYNLTVFHIYYIEFLPCLCRCVEQANKASRGDLTPDELKERQVCLLSCNLSVKLELQTGVNYYYSFQAKGMQDPEIQNILTDPVMRQV